MTSMDCFEKQSIVVNSELTPTIEVTRGQVLEVTVFNELPTDWPQVTEGITVHWHGLDMRGAEFYDGVAYLHQCPITPGTNFTYRFTVDETPGTYWWHGHAGVERVDGFYGPLIIRPNGTEALAYDEERTLLVSDNFHGEANAMTFGLNRPFDATKQTNASGGWVWVDLPQSVLFNNRGMFADCGMGPYGNAKPIACKPAAQWVPPGRSEAQPWAAPTNKGCARYNLTVEAGKTYRLRVINTGSLAYQTLCFEGHNLTIVAADGYPTKPLVVSCLDINLGQRYDVLLKANQAPGNYWLTARPQFRPGSAAGYGVLRYSGANASALPASPAPQPDTLAPWTLAQLNQVRLSADLLGASANRSLAAHLGPNGLSPPGAAARVLLLNNTQPLLSSGQLRWALNNVATYKTPSCQPTLNQIKAQPQYLDQHARVSAEKYVNYDMLQTGNSSEPMVYMADSATPQAEPVAGQQFVTVGGGDVIDVIIQNMPANANGGDYRPGVGNNRTAMEQHPFHFHGHHFWVLGHGTGRWNASAAAGYNLLDPSFRDSYTVFKDGWIAIRFRADNPGLWNLHCHIDYHLFMGQKVYFLEEAGLISQPPPDFPACPATCTYNFAAWAPGTVKQMFGSSGYPARR
ncbi:hypothetical protein WJX81_008696 [Elliptochloris bilobata]|uniref:Laccase n=1 Tax=Elliptochloris bilobata TaxID=381761 RepID=A0AAW1RVP3_9CHLO